MFFAQDSYASCCMYENPFPQAEEVVWIPVNLMSLWQFRKTSSRDQGIKIQWLEPSTLRKCLVVQLLVSVNSLSRSSQCRHSKELYFSTMKAEVKMLCESLFYWRRRWCTPQIRIRATRRPVWLHLVWHASFTISTQAWNVVLILVPLHE